METTLQTCRGLIADVVHVMYDVNDVLALAEAMPLLRGAIMAHLTGVQDRAKSLAARVGSKFDRRPASELGAPIERRARHPDTLARYEMRGVHLHSPRIIRMSNGEYIQDNYDEGAWRSGGYRRMDVGPVEEGDIVKWARKGSWDSALAELRSWDCVRHMVPGLVDGFGAMRCACALGFAQTARWLARAGKEETSPTTSDDEKVRKKEEDDRSDAVPPECAGAFVDACRRGDVETARWIADEFSIFQSSLHLAVDINGRPAVRPIVDFALYAACVGGRSETVAWLVDVVGRPACATRMTGKVGGRSAVARALECACSVGHTETARWLVERFLVPGRALPRGGTSLASACAGGHLETARWLVGVASPQFGERDAREALSAACAGGHLETARWLADRFGLAKTRKHATDCELLIEACLGGHLEMAHWLWQPLRH